MYLGDLRSFVKMTKVFQISHVKEIPISQWQNINLPGPDHCIFKIQSCLMLNIISLRFPHYFLTKAMFLLEIPFFAGGGIGKILVKKKINKIFSVMRYGRVSRYSNMTTNSSYESTAGFSCYLMYMKLFLT